jgi:hypothetical protein
MKHRTRVQYTENQKSQMWDRWQRGESLHRIAQLFDRHHSSVRGILAASGGIRPSLRKRSPRTLTLDEREVISRWLVAANPFVSSPRPCSVHPQPSVARLDATAGWKFIVLVRPTRPPGLERDAPS